VGQLSLQQVHLVTLPINKKPQTHVEIKKNTKGLTRVEVSNAVLAKRPKLGPPP